MNDFPIFRSDLRKKSLGEKSVLRLCMFRIAAIQAPIEEIMAACMIHEEQSLKVLARNCIWKNEASQARIQATQGSLELTHTPPYTTFSFMVLHSWAAQSSRNGVRPVNLRPTKVLFVFVDLSLSSLLNKV